MTTTFTKAEHTRQRLETIHPGEEVVYHVGILARDRGGDSELNKLAKAALKLQEEGILHLHQRKLLSIKNGGEVSYEYIAIGRRG